MLIRHMLCLIFRSILILLCLFASVSFSIAETLSIPTSVRNLRNPSEDLGESRPGEIGQSDRSILKITIGVHTFNDVLRILGKAQIVGGKSEETNVVSEPDPEIEGDAVCYVSSHPGDGTQVVFGSGPMGGWKQITFFQVLDGSLALDLPCAPSPLVKKTIATPSGLRLGASVKSLRFKLGRPTKVEEQGLSFYFQGERRMTPEQINRFRDVHVMEHPFFDVSSGIRLTYHDDQVTSFEVFHSLSR